MLAYVPQDATVLSKITKYEGIENWEFVKNRPSARFFFAFSLFYLRMSKKSSKFAGDIWIH